MTDKNRTEINMEPPTIPDHKDKTDTSTHQYSDCESKFIMTPTEEQKLELDACTAVASISNGHNEGKKDKSPKKHSKVFGNEGAETRYKLWLRCEIVGLAVIIVIILGLFALPIVFYHLPVVSWRHMFFHYVGLCGGSSF